jgi:SAM-dependent methyltransferase
MERPGHRRRDTSHFARAHGYATRSETLDACAFEAESFDGVFVWNTFEQIEEPKALLAEAHRILRPGGVLVLRVPNALFYAACQALGADVALGHANLLGFPHLFGYGSTSLDRVVNAARFETLRHIGDRHITPSLRPLTATAEREASRIDTIVSEVARAFELFQPDVIVHPWLEAIYRRA